MIMTFHNATRALTGVMAKRTSSPATIRAAWMSATVLWTGSRAADTNTKPSNVIARSLSHSQTLSDISVKLNRYGSARACRLAEKAVSETT